MNNVFLKGRLVADPQVRQSGDNTMTTFTIAVDKYSKEGNKADFIDCVAFKKTAEFISNYFNKGKEIIVIGSISVNTYQDKDGNTKKSVNVIVSNVEFCGKQSSGESKEIEEISNDEDLPF